MLEITEQLSNGKRYRHSLHDLRLPSGDYCHRLTREDLYRELVAIQTPDIEPHMGHQQLSVMYSRWVKDKEPRQW